jgi:hypothetical protein
MRAEARAECEALDRLATSKTAPLKTSVPLEAARCPPRLIRVRVAPSNWFHLLTHRCVAVAARRLAGPIARWLPARLKPSHPHFPIKQA